MHKEAQIRAFKLAALQRIADLGLTPGEVGRDLKRLAETTKSGTVSAALSSPFSAVAGLGKTALIALLGGLAATGFGAGIGAEKIFGAREADVEAVRERDRIDQLRRATIRMNAESSAVREEDEEDERRPKRKPQALEILSAVGSGSHG